MHLCNLNRHDKKIVFVRQASYTIELSLLMPLIMGTFFLIIFTSFYLHDMCLISEYGYLAAAEIEEKGPRHAEEVLYSKFEIDFMNKSLGRWNINSEASIDDEKITVVVNGTMLSNESMFSGLINERLFSYSGTYSVYRIDEYSYMRKFSWIKRGV